MSGSTPPGVSDAKKKKTTKKKTTPRQAPPSQDADGEGDQDEVEMSETDERLQAALEVLEKITITDFGVKRAFNRAPFTEEQQEAADRIRSGAAAFSQIIVNSTRNGPERQAALHSVRVASMEAVQAVALR